MAQRRNVRNQPSEPEQILTEPCVECGEQTYETLTDGTPHCTACFFGFDDEDEGPEDEPTTTT